MDPDTLGDTIRSYLWGGVAVVHSLLDWPLRNLSGERAANAGGSAHAICAVHVVVPFPAGLARHGLSF